MSFLAGNSNSRIIASCFILLEIQFQSSLKRFIDEGRQEYSFINEINSDFIRSNWYL